MDKLWKQTMETIEFLNITTSGLAEGEDIAGADDNMLVRSLFDNNIIEPGAQALMAMQRPFMKALSHEVGLGEIPDVFFDVQFSEQGMIAMGDIIGEKNMERPEEIVSDIDESSLYGPDDYSEHIPHRPLPPVEDLG